MRRSFLAVLTALLLVSWPAEAQTPPAERTLLDMTLAVVPQATTSICPAIGAGRLVVALKAVGEGQPKPVTFDLSSVRNTDPGANITATVGAAEASLAAPLQGGLYCVSLTNNAPTSPTAGIGELMGLRQDVAIRMTLMP